MVENGQHNETYLQGNRALNLSRHIVITANTAWNLLNYRAQIIRMLLDSGNRVTLLAPEDDAKDALIAMGCDFEPIVMSRRGKSPLAEAGVLRRLHRDLKRLRPDAVLSFTIKNNIYAGIACRHLGIPFIPNVSGRGAVFSENRAVLGTVLTAYRFAFGKAATVFYQNPEDREIFLNHGIGSQEKAALLPGSGVDLTQFPQMILPKNSDAPVFLMIARVLKDKGVAEYVDAARAVRRTYAKAQFVLIGAHEPGAAYISKEDLNQWRAEGILDYRGTLSDVRSEIAAADIIVLPSYYLEGTPRALLEAAATGRPIITTDTAGCRDVVVDGVNGYLAEPRNAASLAEKMTLILNSNHAKRVEMGHESRKLAQDRFDIRIVVETYRKTLETRVFS